MSKWVSLSCGIIQDIELRNLCWLVIDLGKTGRVVSGDFAQHVFAFLVDPRQGWLGIEGEGDAEGGEGDCEGEGE